MGPHQSPGQCESGRFSSIARGDELVLPNLGHGTLHHGQAANVAQWIDRAIEPRSASIGDVFNAVSEQAVTLHGYAETVFGWFGKPPRVSCAPFDDWIASLGPEDA